MLGILLFTFYLSVTLFFRPGSFIVSKVYCKNISRLEIKIFILLRVFFLCVHVQAGLHIHIFVLVLQSGIDFRQNIDERM